jgi:hypothetical protein
MLARWSLRATLFGLLALYIGERSLSGGPRWAVSGFGAALFLFGVVAALLRRNGAADERRAASGRVLAHYGIAVLGLALYAAGLDDVGLLADGKLETVVQVLWPALVVVGMAPAIALELAIRSAEQAPKLEGWRAASAWRAAVIVVLGAVGFAGTNYAASQWNRKIDLSYFQTTKVGAANTSLLATLSKPVTFYLFFPPGNEVAEYARGYLDELVKASPLATIQMADQALDAELAKRLKVRNNGYLVIESDEKNETLRLGVDLEGAQSTLRKLDGEVHQRLMQVLRPARIAYLTTGHLERDWSPPADDKRAGLSDFKQILETLGYKVKRLGFGEGLGSKIPDDASVVIVPGATEPFLPPEREALHRYLDAGGRLLVFVDPDSGAGDAELLKPLGVQVSGKLVATDDARFMWRMSDRAETPYNLATIKSSAHPSSKTLADSSGRLGVLLAGAGSVTKVESPPAEAKITMTVRTMEKSWVDENGNGKADESEKRSTFDLAAAVEKPEKTDAAGAAIPAMRAVVWGDADLIGNIVVRNQGNVAVVLDALRWLVGDEQLASEVESEEDVRIVHRKDEDAIWFYGTSVLIPVTVLVGGIFYTRRARQKRSST